jgi:hypothetical protein
MFAKDDGADEVHISVAFTGDLPEAERLEKEWKHVAPVKTGGPATGMRGEEFTPGRYLKRGYVITSRGCPNRCWFCSVWRREGETVRELPVTEGFNVLDDNFLACSENHIRAVFAMLAKQKRRPLFTGGLDAAELKPWHVGEFVKLKPSEMFFAYDTPGDREPLYEAGKLLNAAGFKIFHPLRAYVLTGYPGDTLEKADRRLFDCLKAGFMPFAMLWSETGKPDPDWIRFAWPWRRPAVIYAKYRKMLAEERTVV